jgi:hypothetical protein
MPTLGLNLARMLVLVLALAGATAGTAAATGGGGGGGGSTPAGPTLQGQNLVAAFADLDVDSTCVENGTSTVHYHATGLAPPPFPGPFEVDGTITIGEQTEVNPPIGEGTIAGPILTLRETFTIFSGETTISGEKTLTEPLAELGERQRATCQDVTELRGVTGTGRVVEIEAATRYSATISGPSGTFEDSGRATVVLDLVEITGECAPGVECESRSGTFDQLFTLSDQAPPPPPPPPPPCDDDEDGDSQGGDGDDQGCDEDEN